MGQGSYVLCEWDSVNKEYPEFQKTFAELDNRITKKCLDDWSPKSFGGLTPGDEEFGRTTILPALFDDNANAQMAHWRQTFTSVGHQTLISGTRAGNTLPEDFKVAWIGLMFPNKQQHITEIRMQISDGKYGRINLEEMHSYNKPAIIFEDGFLLNEESGFELYGYVEGPIPVDHQGNERIFQRIVMLGAAYCGVKDKLLGAVGAAI